MILLVTGNGKGKTTSALGQAMRVVGDGKKVLMVQFIKSPEWGIGEAIAAKRLEPEFKLVQMGKGFVGIMGDTLPREEHVEAAREALDFAQAEVLSRKWDFIILDEVNVALNLRLIRLENVIQFLDSVPQGVDVMLTGRHAPQELIDRADLVSEVREVKHPFDRGQMGKRGIEY